MSHIVNRVIGTYGISIATNLACEGALGVYEDRPVDISPILSYPTFYVNLRTMFRNVHGSIDKNDLNSVSPRDYADTIMDEMEIISSIMSDATQNKIIITFYYDNYKNIEKKYKSAFFRTDNTPKQKEYTMLHDETMKILLPECADSIHVYDLYIESKHLSKTLILTHIPHDLVKYKSFGHLTLLESHTGNLLERPFWHKKYYNGKDLTMIPFRLDFLQIFGDDIMFRPSQIELRTSIIEMAKKYNWTYNTTEDKIRYSIDQIKNPYAKDLIQQYMRS